MAVYIKSILAGVAAFLVAIIISGVVALAIMFRLPEPAMRIFPAQTFEIQYGASYSPYFPLWQIQALAYWHSLWSSHGCSAENP